MFGYSGNAWFDFEIERYKDKESGTLIAFDTITNEDLEYEYQIIILKVEGRAYYTPGRTYGSIENCYPSENEIDIKNVIGPDGKDWKDKLTKDEIESILNQIQDIISSNDHIDYDL